MLKITVVTLNIRPKESFATFLLNRKHNFFWVCDNRLLCYPPSFFKIFQQIMYAFSLEGSGFRLGQRQFRFLVLVENRTTKVIGQ